MSAPTAGTPTTAQQGQVASLPYSCVVDRPAVSEGDWMIALAVGGSSSGRYWTAPSGWSSLGSRFESDDGWYLDVYIKKATASEPSTYSFDANFVFGEGRVTIVPVSGAADHGDTPFVRVDSNVNGSAGSTSSPSITPTAADSLVLRFLAARNQTDGSITSVADCTLLVNTLSRNYHAVYTQTAGASATGTKAASYTPTWHDAPRHVVVAIAPASGGPSVSIPAIYYAVNRNRR